MGLKARKRDDASAAGVAQIVASAPAAVRSILVAARRAIRAAAPEATEVAYRGGAPRLKQMMWKIARYTVDGEPVVAFGTFPAYSAIFFFRGRELADDGNDLLEGGGKQLRFVRLRTAADAARPAIRRLVQAAIRLARSPGSR